MKRGSNEAHAVLLNATDYGESDMILTFYTEEFGKVKGIAKGARRSRRRFVGALDAPSHVKGIFHHSEKSDLVRVDAASLTDGFSGLKTDVLRYAESCCLLELVSETTREGQPSAAIYRLLLEFLRLFETGGDNKTLLLFFEIKLLGLAGYLPHLDGCVACARPFDGDGGRIVFSSERGGALCARCSGNAGIPLSVGTARMLSNAARLDVDKLGRLKPSQTSLDESERLLDAFIIHHIGKELKTKKFLTKLKRAAYDNERRFV